MQAKIRPNLWFDANAEEAAAFYVSVFKDSRIVTTTRYPAGAPGPEGTVMTVEWELDGQSFIGINGGPLFTFSEAVSLEVQCADQAEVDYYWDALTADGGAPGPCGWLKDPFGLSWQIVPAGWDQILNDADPKRAERAMAAMLKMGKLDIAALLRAAEGETVDQP
jgi:predicted 3-demethylubiquinone-9 3-methyltransferase (glyoxalase superfamily)